jgi:hypothetical protein
MHHCCCAVLKDLEDLGVGTALVTISLTLLRSGINSLIACDSALYSDSIVEKAFSACSLQLACPGGEGVSSQLQNISRPRLNADGIMLVLDLPETRKVSIDLTINS